MLRVAAVMIAIAACGTPPQPVTRAMPHAPASPAVVTTEPALPALVHPATPRARIEAPHGGDIIALAITGDGKAAITADELGGLRLWPALDGSAEPRVVDAPRPRALAIGAEPRGFLVAITDEAGGLVLSVIDPDGITVQRASLPAEPAFAGVEMTARGALAWRVDQVLVRYGADGALTGELPAESGQRILAVAVAGDRAIAVIDAGSETARTTRARWLTLGPTLAWGAWIGGASHVGAQVALSPSGKRLSWVSATSAGARTQRAIVVDTEQGQVIASEGVASSAGFGLFDDDHLVVASQAGLTWSAIHPGRTNVERVLPVGEARTQKLVAVGGGHAVAAVNGELVLATPTSTQYLGYELESPAVVAAAPHASLLIGLGETFALLDGSLRAIGTPAIPVPPQSAIAELRWLAGDDWLVESSRIRDGSTTLALVDLARTHSQVVRTGMTMVQVLRHAPATHLVTMSFGAIPEVLRYVPEAHRIDKVSTLAKAKTFEQVELAPVSPALAGGVQVVVVAMRDRMTLRWVHDPRALDKGIAITLDGSLAAVDAAGRAFVWQHQPAGPLALAIYRDGTQLGTLPGDGPAIIVPDPGATEVLELGERDVSVVGVDGTRRWAQPLQGVTEGLWLDDGSIAVVSAGGLVRLDAATGEVRAARCGWRFGLSANPHPVSARIEPLCTQLRP